jgi:hypothetical protein
MTDLTYAPIFAESAGQVAYERWCEETESILPDPWRELTADHQAVWNAVAEAVHTETVKLPPKGYEITIRDGSGVRLSFAWGREPGEMADMIRAAIERAIAGDVV